ncbi:hypothetical protein SLS55_003777 [Diplodia seriata]|uniref:Uncharacterized protein n=1 Tax=Diplodia seriata TaxID=420778 RepID=A0ABR3CNW3_9PEZI
MVQPLMWITLGESASAIEARQKQERERAKEKANQERDEAAMQKRLAQFGFQENQIQAMIKPEKRLEVQRLDARPTSTIGPTESLTPSSEYQLEHTRRFRHKLNFIGRTYAWMLRRTGAMAMRADECRSESESEDMASDETDHTEESIAMQKVTDNLQINHGDAGQMLKELFAEWIEEDSGSHSAPSVG